MFKLGGSRLTIVWVQAAELGIVVALGVFVAMLLTWATLTVSPRLLQIWLG